MAVFAAKSADSEGVRAIIRLTIAEAFVMRGSHRSPRKGGFTLVEMLVVIGVISLLMSLVLPAMASFKAQAKSTNCLSNLRQLHAAFETSRQARKDLFPFAAPLPVAPGQAALVPGLPETMQAIVPAASEAWMCPSDTTEDSEQIGASYVYVPGAFMLFEPPLMPPPQPPMTEAANRQRVARLITERFSNGYLRGVPILADSGDYHAGGNRQPRNAVFMDGSARIIKPTDGDIEPPDQPSP